MNGGGSEGWKKALRDSAISMVENGEIQGYLAYDGDLAVGWCNANDRLNYCRVREFDLASVPPDEPCDDCQRKGQAKAVVCFEIAPEYRGKGIATQLLDAVCRDALNDGYEYVEAYPVKDEGMQGLAFTGPKRLYEKAGFTAAAQKDNTLVMRRRLSKTIAASGESKNWIAVFLPFHHFYFSGFHSPDIVASQLLKPEKQIMELIVDALMEDIEG